MKDKQSFVLYADLIHTVKKLPDHKAGELFKLILAYVNDEDPQTEDILLQISFEPIKQQLKRDLKRWSEQLEQRKAAGKKSAEMRAAKSTTVNDRSTKPNETQQASTDNVTVNVNDTVTVNEILLEKVPKSKPSKKVPDYSAEDLGKCKPDRLPVLMNWLEYKRERNEGYKTIGLQTLVKKFNSFMGPVTELESIVEGSIINNYSGIVWFKYQNKQLQQSTKNPIG